MPSPKLSESIIRAIASAQSFQRGQALYNDGAISNAVIQGNVLSSDCEGTSAPHYHVRVTLDVAGIREAHCSCAHDSSGYCKHVVALLLTYYHRPKRFAVRKEAAELLIDLDHEDLVALITRLMRDHPNLYELVEAAIAPPPAKSKTAKRHKKKVNVDAYRRQIIGILHSLDGMRASQAYWLVGALAQELGTVRETAIKFLDAGDPDAALAILLTLLEETCRGVEFIDDSNGELGDFVGKLDAPLAEVILSLELSALEREKLLKRLAGIDHHASAYGMDDSVYLAMQAARHGWDEPPADSKAKRKAAHARGFDEAIKDYGWSEEDVYDVHDWGWLPPSMSDLTEAKLNILERQGRIDDYLALCKKKKRHLQYALKLCELDRVPEAIRHAKKHLNIADEARQLGEKLHALKHIHEALQIGEYGLGLKESKAALGRWLAPIEEAQGRTKQASRAWMAVLPESPSLDIYEAIKRLGESSWNRLRTQAMAVLRKSRDKQALVDVLLFEEEWDEAIQVAEGREVWYTVSETVADGVLEHRPEWVAQVSIKHAERLMIEPKSKRYPIAAEWLKRAKKAYARLDRKSEWRAYVRTISEKYKRRPALQAHLRHL